MTRTVLALAAVALGIATGCGGEDPKPVEGVGACPADRTIAGVCAGVPSAPLCDGSACTAGVSCAQVIAVASDSELAAATGSAMAGTCIVLAPGSYTDVVVPGGVSLLGRAASQVKLRHIEVGPGAGTVVRGVTVDGGGVTITTGAEETRIEATRITASSGDGIEVRTEANVRVVASEIADSARYGVGASGARGVALESTFIHGSKGPGVWAECVEGCACPVPIEVDIKGTIVRDSKRVGMSLVGAHATLTGVEIGDNTVGANFQASGGLAASKCSDVTARGLRVADNSAFGILLDDSSGSLGAAGDDQSVEVERNLIGIWMQGIEKSMTTPLKLENAHVKANSGVGVGLGGTAKGIIIYGCEIKETELMTLPVLVHGISAGSEKVGDGLSWLAGSAAQIEQLTLEGNGRASVLIDGEVATGSSIANVTLSGGDETKGVVEQNFPSGGLAPTVGAGAPAIQASASELFSVPRAPEVPSGG